MATTFRYNYICNESFFTNVEAPGQIDRGGKIGPCDSISSVRTVGQIPLYFVEELSS